MIAILADITATDAGTMIGALILALISGGVLHKKFSTKQDVTLKNPVPELSFRKVANPVSYDQHSALDARVGRIEGHLDRIERDQALQYKQILEAGGERELRMTEALHAGLRSVHERLDQLLTTRTTRSR